MRQPTQDVIEGAIFHRDQNNVFYPRVLRGRQRVFLVIKDE
jgi:hypothetical protein